MRRWKGPIVREESSREVHESFTSATYSVLFSQYAKMRSKIVLGPGVIKSRFLCLRDLSAGPHPRQLSSRTDEQAASVKFAEKYYYARRGL